MLAEFPTLDWEEVDLVEHPEDAARYAIMSVPALVVDGELVFTSVPREDALREKIEAVAERRWDVAKKIQLSVEGMSCIGCENNLRFALSSLAGVESAKADYKANTVEVAYDPSVATAAEIREAIERIGYTVVSDAA